MGSALHRSLLCSSRFILLWMIASLTGIAPASSESLAKSSSVALVAATLMWHATPTVAQDNVAQGKTATQISTRLGAASAVDGSMNTASCTLAQLNTWWAVDLGAQYDVATVNVTSYTFMNDNAYILGLIDFKVGLSNTAPPPGAVTVDVECGQQSGTISNMMSETFSIECASTGQTYQYVVIQGSQTVSAELCMDEVEVYLRTTSTVTTASTEAATTAAATTTGAQQATTAAATTADPSVTTTTAATTTAATTTAATTEAATTSAPSSTVPLVAALITLGALYCAAAVGVVCFISIPRYLARRRATLGIENVVVEEIVHQPPPQQLYPEPAPPPFQRSNNYWPQRRRYY